MAITSLMGDVAMTIKGKMPGQVNIDNKVFQLHYRLTTFLFLGKSIRAPQTCSDFTKSFTNACL